VLVCMSVCECVWICVRVYVHTYVYVHIYVYVFMYFVSILCIHTYRCVCAYTRTHPHTHTHTRTHTRTHTHTYTYIHTDILSHTHTYNLSHNGQLLVQFVHIYTHLYTCIYAHTYVYTYIYNTIHTHPTGWRRLIGSPKLQIIFHKRATKYRALLRKMTYQDKGSYESSPPCTMYVKSWPLFPTAVDSRQELTILTLSSPEYCLQQQFTVVRTTPVHGRPSPSRQDGASLAEYSLFYRALLQKRPIILSIHVLRLHYM